MTQIVIFNALLESDVLDHINGILMKMSNSRSHVTVRFGAVALCQRNLGLVFGVQNEHSGKRGVKSLGRGKECTGKKAGMSFTCEC